MMIQIGFVRASRHVRITFPILLAFVLASLVGCNKDVSDKDLEFVDTPVVRRQIDSAKPGHLRVIDARSPTDYRAGHLPKAVNLTVADLPDGARPPAEISSAKNVIVYGQSPVSGLARGLAKRLILAGHKGVKVYEGGIEAWTQSGYALEKPAAE